MHPNTWLNLINFTLDFTDSSKKQVFVFTYMFTTTII